MTNDVKSDICRMKSVFLFPHSVQTLVLPGSRSLKLFVPEAVTFCTVPTEAVQRPTQLVVFDSTIHNINVLQPEGRFASTEMSQRLTNILRCSKVIINKSRLWSKVSQDGLQVNYKVDLFECKLSKITNLGAHREALQ